MGSTRKEKGTSSPFLFHLETIINEDLIADQLWIRQKEKEKEK